MREEGAKQEGTSDVAYSRNQPPHSKADQEPQRHSIARESGTAKITQNWKVERFFAFMSFGSDTSISRDSASERWLTFRISGRPGLRAEPDHPSDRQEQRRPNAKT